MQADLCAGIDVSKLTLDVAFNRDIPAATFQNDDLGVAELVALLRDLRPVRIVFEPTGGYERRLELACTAAGLPAVKVNARKTRNFAKAEGILAKTDRLDAHCMALYGEKMRPVLWPPPEPRQRHLMALLNRRAQLVKMCVAECNRLEKEPLKEVAKWTRAHLRQMKRQRDAVDTRIAQLIEDDPDWRAKAALIGSVPAVGPVLVATLLAWLPELWSKSAKTLAAVCGVAPLNRDSGQLRGKRSISGGRQVVRNALYMSCMAGLRHNRVLKGHYDRWVEAGKPPKVALTACMNKLLKILRAMTSSGESWREAAS